MKNLLITTITALLLTANAFATWESTITDPPTTIPAGYTWGCSMRSIAFDGLGKSYYGESGKADCNANTMHQPWEACIVQYECQLHKIFVPEKGTFVCTAGSTDKGFIFKGYGIRDYKASAQAFWLCQQGSIESHTCVVKSCEVVK